MKQNGTALTFRAITVETSETYVYDPEQIRTLYEFLKPDPDLYGDDPAYAVFAYLDNSDFHGDVFQARGDYGQWPIKDEVYDPEA